MLILLPPSEGKSRETGAMKLDEGLLFDARKVLAHAKRLKAAERAKFYGAKDAKKSVAIHRLNVGAPEASAMRVLERYTGVVYRYLDYASLGPKREAERRIHVVSALWGLVRGDAGIPDYTLSMNPWLARYWRPINGERLRAAAQGEVVLNLLSQSYAKAIEYDNLVSVDFKVRGGKKSAGHFGKAIKGRFARYLIENRVRSVEGFEGFSEDGYRFDGSDFVQA